MGNSSATDLPDNPSLDELRALLALRDHNGVVTAAAEHLGIPQPTLSRQLTIFKRKDKAGIAVLELLERKGDRPRLTGRLTTRGERLLPGLRAFMRQYDQMLAYLAGSAQQPQLVLLGAGHFAMRHYLPGVMAELCRRDDPCELRVPLARGQDRIVAVASGELDLATVTHDPGQIDTICQALPGSLPPLAVVPLSSQPLCMAVSCGSAAAETLKAIPPKRAVPERLLFEWEFVGLDEQSGIRRRIQSLLRADGQEIRFVARTGAGGWLVAKELTLRGVGPALLPVAELNTDDLKRLVVRTLGAKFTVDDF